MTLKDSIQSCDNLFACVLKLQLLFSELIYSECFDVLFKITTIIGIKNRRIKSNNKLRNLINTVYLFSLKSQL